MCAALAGNNILPIWKFRYTWLKKVHVKIVKAQNLQNIKLFWLQNSFSIARVVMLYLKQAQSIKTFTVVLNWLLNRVSISRVVGLFPQASLSHPAATAAH